MKHANLIHNILTALAVLSAAATAWLIEVGCVAVEAGFDCSASPVDPKVTTAVIIGAGVLKFAINYVRDGLKGFYAEQPPIEKKED